MPQAAVGAVGHHVCCSAGTSSHQLVVFAAHENKIRLGQHACMLGTFVGHVSCKHWVEQIEAGGEHAIRGGASASAIPST